jgi:cytochrome c oxidase assembly protein subunit 15
MSNHQPSTINRQLSIWLFACAFMVFAMVIVGGLTRLTESGLSITEWKPLHGAIPPLSLDEWNAEFELYKKIPEYQQINKGMSLDEFKKIYWWEYGHRLLGRLVGLVFFIPFVYFLLSKKLSKKLAIKFFIIFLLGGLQGFMGWYMVKSGLSERTDVSHYRLAAHLGLALILFSLLLANAFKLWFANMSPRLHDGVDSADKGRYENGLTYLTKPSSSLIGGMHAFKLFLFIQIIWGAFVAGLNAGMTYNTWPFMDGDFIPTGFNIAAIAYDISSVQFVHRWLAFVVIFWLLFTYIRNRAEIKILKLNKQFYILFALVALQIALGIWALLSVVEIAIASKHQALATILLGYTIYLTTKLNLAKNCK